MVVTFTSPATADVKMNKRDDRRDGAILFLHLTTHENSQLDRFYHFRGGVVSGVSRGIKIISAMLYKYPNIISLT